MQGPTYKQSNCEVHLRSGYAGRRANAVIYLQSAIAYSLRAYCIDGVRPKYETYAWRFFNYIHISLQRAFAYIHIKGYTHYIDSFRVCTKAQRRILGAVVTGGSYCPTLTARLNTIHRQWTPARSISDFRNGPLGPIAIGVQF